jgi:methylenetetrahydrofolate reductase (NADPH)
MAGIIPVRAAAMARYMKDNVPGVYVPEQVVKRMEGAKSGKEEGLNMAVELVHQVREIKGVHGVHIMAVGWEEVVPQIVERAGLMPRPSV